VTLPSRTVRNPTFELQDAPEGVAVRTVSCKDGVAEIAVTCDPARAKPDTRGNLILHAFAERAPDPKSNPPRPSQRVSVGIVPAIPFEISASITALR
jgi:hypothetical protein